MIEFALFIFFLTLSLELFGKRFLALALVPICMLIFVGAITYILLTQKTLSSQSMLLSSAYMCGIAWAWGISIGALFRMARGGSTQLVLTRISLSWVSSLPAILMAMIGAYHLGFALAMNTAIIYADQVQNAWIMYNQSIEAAYQGIFWLSIAGFSFLFNIFNPAIKRRGILFSMTFFVPWNNLEAYEWNVDKLIVYPKSGSILFWPRRLSLTVSSVAQQAAVNKLLSQQLTEKQSQPPRSVQVNG